MRNKLHFVIESLKECNLDLLCITETWLLPSDVAIIEAALPECFSFLHVPRSTATRGGGVGLFFSGALSSVKVVAGHTEISSFEVMEVTFSLCLQTFRLAIVYRPGHPGTDRTFMDEFSTILEGMLSGRGKPLICGDFNYWVDDPVSKPYTQEFMRMLDVNNMVNHVSVPTHVSGHTLDLVLVPVGADLVNALEVLPIDRSVSDHALLTFELNVTRPATNLRTITFRSYRGLNETDAGNIIKNNLSGTIAPGYTSTQLVSSYNSVLASLRDQSCPLITKEIRVRDDAQWYDHRVVSLRRQRRKAERDWRRLRTDATRASYVSARMTVVKQVFTCKVEYFQNQLALAEGNQWRTFMILNGLLKRAHDPVMPSSMSNDELASCFSDFFAAKVDRIRGEIDSDVANKEFSVNIVADFALTITFSQFSPVTEADVRRYIRESRKTCCPLDPINVSKLGSAYDHAVPMVVAIINASFVEGNFVVSEKRGLLRPYLKKIGLDVDNLGNYRPVTNLSYLSKVMERAMLEQLVPFLEEVGAIPHCQSAYRKFHSTETALCKIYDDLVSSTCLGKVSLLILLDLSAAFDTVDHQMLLNDFSNYGVDGVALLLLKSYLTDREQCVVVGESRSEPKILHCGVPQGSVLGPVLFTVYTSTFASLLNAHGVDYHFYADDSQLYIRVENIQEAKDRLISLLSDIKIWMAKRKLKLNDGKTEIMVIKGNLRNTIETDFGDVTFEDTQLVPCENAKNLGVVLDSSLNFRSHIDSVTRTCNFHIRNLYMIKNFINRRNLITLVHSLIVSKVDYCNSLLVGLPNVTLKKVQSILNRAARLIYSLSPRVHITPFLIDLHWLPVKARIEFKICLIVFKALKFNQPSYIRELLHRPVHESALNLRSLEDPYRLHEPRAICEKGFAGRSFSYTAPRLYNRLPVSLKQVDSLDAFKSHLKAFIFSKVYSQSDQTVREEYAL